MRRDGQEIKAANDVCKDKKKVEEWKDEGCF
jgi:hypothetical protein